MGSFHCLLYVEFLVWAWTIESHVSFGGGFGSFGETLCSKEETAWEVASVCACRRERIPGHSFIFLQCLVLVSLFWFSVFIQHQTERYGNGNWKVVCFLIIRISLFYFIIVTGSSGIGLSYPSSSSKSFLFVY